MAVSAYTPNQLPLAVKKITNAKPAKIFPAFMEALG
jgi:hypothetical protein